MNTAPRPEHLSLGNFPTFGVFAATPAFPRRETLGNQIGHRYAEYPGGQNHLMVGDTAEENFYLGNPRPADVTTLQLASPGEVRLGPILAAPDDPDPGANDVLIAVVPHASGRLPRRIPQLAQICEQSFRGIALPVQHPFDSGHQAPITTSFRWHGPSGYQVTTNSLRIS